MKVSSFDPHEHTIKYITSVKRHETSSKFKRAIDVERSIDTIAFSVKQKLGVF